MQFLKKHHIAILYAVIALFLVFFGFRLYGDSAKVGDVIFSAFFCSALLILPAVEVGDKILKKLAELEPKTGYAPQASPPLTPYPEPNRRDDLNRYLISTLGTSLLSERGMNAQEFAAFIRKAAQGILGDSPILRPDALVAVGGKRGCTCATNQGCIACASSGAQADRSAEDEILAAGLTAPRVTQDQIQALMDKLIWRYEQPEGTTSTFAHAFLGRFYVASGHSACVSPENFNADLGMKYAREQAEGKARDKLWELEGYKLFAAQAGAQAQCVQG